MPERTEGGLLVADGEIAPNKLPEQVALGPDLAPAGKMQPVGWLYNGFEFGFGAAFRHEVQG